MTAPVTVQAVSEAIANHQGPFTAREIAEHLMVEEYHVRVAFTHLVRAGVIEADQAGGPASFRMCDGHRP